MAKVKQCGHHVIVLLIVEHRALEQIKLHRGRVLQRVPQELGDGRVADHGSRAWLRALLRQIGEPRDEALEALVLIDLLDRLLARGVLHATPLRVPELEGRIEKAMVLPRIGHPRRVVHVGHGRANTVLFHHLGRNVHLRPRLLSFRCLHGPLVVLLDQLANGCETLPKQSHLALWAQEVLAHRGESHLGVGDVDRKGFAAYLLADLLQVVAELLEHDHPGIVHILGRAGIGISSISRRTARRGRTKQRRLEGGVGG
eukprot:7003786-Pyramimonas_sp.AAC.1